MGKFKLAVKTSIAGRPRNARGLAVVEWLEPRKLLSVNVTSWHNDAQQTGLNPNEQILTPTDVGSGTFGELFSYPVTGQIYAQPLYVSNLNIPGMGTLNVVFVATQHNDIYAFNANSNSGPTAGLIWHVNLGPAAASPSPNFGGYYGVYNDIKPYVGITSTPVINLATDTMYIDDFTNDVAGQNVYSHHIHALNILTGADEVTPVLVGAAVAGNGAGSVNGVINFTAQLENQRPALTLFNGTLYVAFASYAASGPYHGWILGFNATTLTLISVFNDSPTLLTSGTSNAPPDQGGIWQTGSGLGSDGTNLFVITGAGNFESAIGDWGDSMLKLTPDTTTANTPELNGYGIHVTDYFTPDDQQQLDDADIDLGSGGGIVLPTQPGPYPDEYIGGGKEGLVYLINRDNFGQYSTTTNNVLSTVSLGNAIFSSPAYFNENIYYQADDDVLKKYTITNGLLSTAPTAESTIAYDDGEGATPSISSNGTANGIVWDVEFDPTAHEVLRAYDANTLTELYDSNQVPARDQLGPGGKFITPTIADGEVFVGGYTALTVFGLLTPPTTIPLAPTALTATALSASSIALNWVDNSNNESGFILERSTDDLNFTPIDLASANAISYTDSSVLPNTQYYYEVCATNIIGNSAFTTPATGILTPSGTSAVDQYHFDEGTGTTTIDSAGTINGTLVGTTLPTWASPGYQGNSALLFSGDGIYNSIANESAVQLSSSLTQVLGGTSTLDFWVKTTQVGSGLHWQAPAVTGVESYYSNNDINWGTINNVGQIGIFVGDAGGVYSTNPINDNQWHNVGITRNATSGVVALYVDGVLQGTATEDTGLKTSQFSSIGELTDVAQDGVTRTGGTFFNGELDEVRIYNTALGQNQIQSLALIPAAPLLSSVTSDIGPVVALAFSESSTYAQMLTVERATSPTGPFTAVATQLPPTITTWDDNNVSAGTTYYYYVVATDSAGNTSSGTLSVTPPIPTVVANSIFYNNSIYDGNLLSSNPSDDDKAIDTGKTALLPGGTATFANVSSFSKGINGIIIDVANIVDTPRPEDFTFLVGNNNNPSTWTLAPTPSYINSYPGKGIEGSTQITVIWSDDVIKNEWLQVTLLAQPHIGLAANDVFYFGNAIGFTDSSTTNAIVTSADATNVTSNETSSAAVTNLYDINRDGVVDATDVALAQAGEDTQLTALNLISLAPTAAQQPTGLTATPKAGSVTLNWNSSTNATSYNIYRGTSANGEAATPLVTGVTGTTYVDSGLSSTSTYYYFVTAMTPESGASNEVSATPLPVPPAQPIGVTATPGVGSITLKWNASTNAIGYNIYRSPTAGGEGATPYMAGITATTYIDSSVVSTSTYYYKVTALSPESAASMEVSATPLPVPPAKPTGLTAIGGYGGITLSWNVSNNATSYDVYRGNSSGGESATPIAIGISTTTYTDNSFTSIGAWYYYVTALTPQSAASNEASATPLSIKLTGLPIGTQTSWLNNGDTIAQVFDGNFNTYYDAPNSNLTNWVGIDLLNPETVTQIKYAPRAGYNWRMIGGQFQASSTPDFSSNVVTLAAIAAAPSYGQFTTIQVNPGAAYRYVRYVGGTGWVNIAEMEVDGTANIAAPVTQLTGAVIGTQGSYGNDGNTIYNIFDGNVNTFFDPPDGTLTDWAGLDMYVPETITQISYSPRSGYAYRMVGGQFQESSSPTFASNVITLATITTPPTSGVMNTINVADFGPYRYVRFVGGTQWVNIAEMSVSGVYTPPPVSSKLPGTVIGTSTSWLNNGDTIAQVFDGNFNTFYDGPNSSLTNWVGLDLGTTPSTITQIQYAPRAGYAYRMVGGQFQVSTSATFSTNVMTIYTITVAPTAGIFTSIAVSVPGSYEYIRYVGGTGWVNIAEMEVDGHTP